MQLSSLVGVKPVVSDQAGGLPPGKGDAHLFHVPTSAVPTSHLKVLLVCLS